MVTQNTVPSHLTGDWVRVELTGAARAWETFYDFFGIFLGDLDYFHSFMFGPKVLLLLFLADITN